MVASGTKKLCCIGFGFEFLNSGERFRAIVAVLLCSVITSSLLCFLRSRYPFFSESVYIVYPTFILYQPQMFTGTLSGLFHTPLCTKISLFNLTLLHSEQPKLHRVLAVLRAIGLRYLLSCLQLTEARHWHFFSGRGSIIGINFASSFLI